MKKLNAFGKILCVSALLSVIGVVIYLINSVTGYLSNSSVNALVIVLPLICAAASACLLFLGQKLPGVVIGIATFALSLILAWSTVVLVTERVDVIGDMLNPVNHSSAQVTAVVWSIVAIVVYFLSFLGTAISTLTNRLSKA